MAHTEKPPTETAQSLSEHPAYSTFPHVTTHGPRDRRCFHGKAEDWQRTKVKRTFGGKIK
jgi:hypothetical protein